MDEVRLWKVGPDQTASMVEGLSQMESEWQLEELVVANPELLEAGITLVGRQTPTAGGWLDLLGVDKNGRLVVFELKRGSLGRDAVTQVLDYASFLSLMDGVELADHVSKRSGQGGIPVFEDFEHWYTERFADLKHLYPIRMVIVGLGIDDVALRVARFLSQASLEVEVITLHGFRNNEDVLIARQLPVQGEQMSHRNSALLPIDERRRLLSQRVAELGLTELFEAVRDAIHDQLGGRTFVDARKFGVSLQLGVVSATGIRGPRPFFGVYAAYTTPSAIEVSLNTITQRHNPEEYEQLTSLVPVVDWPHGGRAIIINDEAAWERFRPDICSFAEAVYQRWQEYRLVPTDHTLEEQSRS